MATNVKGLRYFYQVDLKGDPIPGSNTKLKRRPIVKGKGQKWVEYVPANEAIPCCPTGGLKVEAIGKKWRYWVRLRTPGVSGENPEPISGTLEKHKLKPTSFGWQEVVGRHQCESTSQFNATYPMDGEASASINLLDMLNLGYGISIGTTGSLSTDNGDYDLTVGANGDVTITQNVAASDFIELKYTNQSGCDVAFKLTITA